MFFFFAFEIVVTHSTYGLNSHNPWHSVAVFMFFFFYSIIEPATHIHLNVYTNESGVGKKMILGGLDVFIISFN